MHSVALLQGPLNTRAAQCRIKLLRGGTLPGQKI